jgi:hypothetical protein
MGIISGYIEGILTFDQSGNAKALPFQDKIEGATFTYNTESLLVETFGGDGMKGASDACPYRHECMIELRTKNLAWSFLQAASGALARDAIEPTKVTYDYVVTTDDITGDTATIDVTWTPQINTDIVVADIDGINYGDITFTSGTPNTLAFGDATTPAVAGVKVTISYFEAPTGTNNEIGLGTSERLPEVGLYGRWYGCPDTLAIQVNRAIIDSQLELGVESEAASAALTARALRDTNGNFAIIKRITG